MPAKDNMMTIGEIAKSMGITRRIILNYEDHGLINADTRGEGNKGYRYYSMNTLVRIRTIRNFQNFGLSLDEIKEYLDGGDNLGVALKRLEILRDELNLNIEKLRERINTNSSVPSLKITELPPQTIYSRTMRDVTIEDRTNHLRNTAYIAFNTHGVNISRRLYFIEYLLNDPNNVTYCAAVPDGSKGDDIIELPKAHAISCYHHGAYSEIPAVRNRLIEYADDHHIPLAGKCRHIYLEGPPQHKDPSKFITMIALLIKE